MALRGFAEGALAGFGAVNKFYDDGRRRDLEQQQIDNLKEYRDETSRAAALDRGIRSRQLDATISRNERLDTIAAQQADTSALRAQTAATQAGTARITAQTARSEQERINRSVNEAGETPEEVSQRLLNDARTRNLSLENVETEMENNRQQGAIDISRMMEIASISGTPSQELQNEFDAIFERNRKNPTFFNAATIMSQAERDRKLNFDSIFASLSQGQMQDLTRSQKEAVARTFNLDNAAYIGQSVDDMPNAPAFLKGQNRKVIGADFYDAKISGTGGDPNLNGTMVVWTEDANGDPVPYTAPLTMMRSPQQNQALPITLDEVVRGSAGFNFMTNSMLNTPNFENMTERALIKQIYGKKGGTGQEDFDKAVKEQMDIVERAYSNGQDSIPDLDYLLDDEESLQTVYERDIEVLRRRVKDNLLNRRAPTSWGRLSDKWFSENAKALANIRLDGSVIGVNAGRRQRAGINSPTIGDFFPKFKDGNFDNAKAVAHLTSFFDRETQDLRAGIGKGKGPNGEDIPDRQYLIEVLRDYGADI